MNAKLSATTAPSDTALLTIEARHIADDVWFRAGHHDPNGYIGMAHADRGALLESLRNVVPRERSAETIQFTKAGVSCSCPIRSDYVFRGHQDGCPAKGTYERSATITIPRAAWDWLMDIKPDDEGYTIEDIVDGASDPARRIRTTFRRMCGL